MDQIFIHHEAAKEQSLEGFLSASDPIHYSKSKAGIRH